MFPNSFNLTRIIALNGGKKGYFLGFGQTKRKLKIRDIVIFLNPIPSEKCQTLKSVFSLHVVNLLR